MVVVLTDVSERRRTERALIQAQRLEAMGQVAGRIAHDFYNLLTLIIGYGALLDRTVGTDQQRQMLARIDDAAKRAAALTGQMLGFTRRQLGAAVVLDLAAGVANLEPVLRRLAGECVELTVDVRPRR
ncbi:MAG: histidine kinase dimerization/phospho-acceptor domain-containing protein [Acidimicrobiales bacterium]